MSADGKFFASERSFMVGGKSPLRSNFAPKANEKRKLARTPDFRNLLPSCPSSVHDSFQPRGDPHQWNCRDHVVLLLRVRFSRHDMNQGHPTKVGIVDRAPYQSTEYAMRNLGVLLLMFYVGSCCWSETRNSLQRYGHPTSEHLMSRTLLISSTTITDLAASFSSQSH